MTPPASTSPWQDPATLRQFLRNVRGAVPLTIDQVESILQLLAAARERVESVLILGCQEGVLAAAILDEHPHAQALLVDESEALLDTARHHLEAHLGRVHFLRADFLQPGWMTGIFAHAPFDAVITGFATLEAEDAQKHALYRDALSLLQPEGLFLNLEYVASATRWTQSALDDCTINAIFGEELRASPRKPRAEVAREFYARATGLAPLEVQCDWLREIGFENVECFLKVQELAIFGGQRPGNEAVSADF